MVVLFMVCDDVCYVVWDVMGNVVCDVIWDVLCDGVSGGKGSGNCCSGGMINSKLFWWQTDRQADRKLIPSITGSLCGHSNI